MRSSLLTLSRLIQRVIKAIGAVAVHVDYFNEYVCVKLLKNYGFAGIRTRGPSHAKRM